MYWAFDTPGEAAREVSHKVERVINSGSLIL